MELQHYYVEFLTIALAHLIAVASPGPDFAVVLKHSIKYGRQTALITSVGVGSAILIHVAYALAGIGLIINSTPWLYDVLIIIAATFLIYLGWGAVRSPASDALESPEIKEKPHTGVKHSNSEQLSMRKAFIIGFMTNGLNPKATLFFLSLFTVVISAETPMVVKGVYGVYLAMATAVWFSFLSLMLTQQKVRNVFVKKGYLFDRVMGWVLIALALHIIVSQFFIS